MYTQKYTDIYPTINLQFNNYCFPKLWDFLKSKSRLLFDNYKNGIDILRGGEVKPWLNATRKNILPPWLNVVSNYHIDWQHCNSVFWIFDIMKIE